MMSRSSGRATALVGLTVLLAMAGLASPAAACACGAPAPIPGTEVGVDRETAIVRWDGDVEEIVMQLDMISDVGETGLIVPTPAPATVSLGDGDVFAALEVAMQPIVTVEWDWWGLDGFLGTSGAAPEGAGAPPVVLARVQLGPIEAVTLAASDTQGLQDWLATNGYALRPEVTAELGGYVDDGWSFVALKLTGDEPFDGELDPIRFRFATDELVYPMRLSHAAVEPQTVRLYLLGEHRAVVSAVEGYLDANYTVPWAAPLDHPDLLKLGSFLTVVDLYFYDPELITSDLLIADAPDDSPVIQTYTVTHTVALLGFPVGPLIVGGVVVLLLILTIVLVRVRQGKAH